MSEARWKIYSDSGTTLPHELAEEMNRRLEAARAMLADDLYCDGMGIRKTPPRSWFRRRVRSPLGWWLWRVAAWVEPDVTL